ncbi:DUF3748 domain-containing protein [Echinicola strongylocentroti]|uniref:DUF3748 domain-containing protein n=1 Tax=Echinicola strongylocentroti TaxID=1795355 RepID=A0A2Z4IED4_9BACT|nr:DUF3748 domain-containing protein [Echinicola strongylocentroti]AWW28838.1 DUF3748 domain-containing protein [Echinicola strongylocentroti]
MQKVNLTSNYDKRGIDLYKLLLIGMISLMVLSCRTGSNKSVKTTNEIIEIGLKEKQLTFDFKGHFLNQRQVFSPDDVHVVFDNRNDDGKIGENGSIQRLNIENGKIETIYFYDQQSKYGPGMGAVSYHPKKEEVVFIHGLKNASREDPYDFTRRFAMKVQISEVGDHLFRPMESRDVQFPYTKGALRGGSHAYSYSSDGQWVSFTYNDDILRREAETNQDIADLRTVGALWSGDSVDLKGKQNEKNFKGERVAFVLARVNEDPKPGSSEIMKAYEECWVSQVKNSLGSNSNITYSLAYLGDIINKKNEKSTEVFISQLPSQPNQMITSTDAGTEFLLPSVPAGVIQKRLTFTQDRKYPGVQGPRQWLRSSPDGQAIYFCMKDNLGEVQIYKVVPNSGEISQITNNSFSLDTSFSLSSDGNYLAYGYEEGIFITNVSDGVTRRVLSNSEESSNIGLSNINWSNKGYQIVYNRKVLSGAGRFYQVFLLDLSKHLKKQ